MKKVKSLVKKLLGKPNNSPFTIDTVQETLNGFCVNGWYFSNELSSVSVVTESGEKADVKTISIPRDDVQSVTGKKASGFELHVATTMPVTAFKFCARTLDDNDIYAPLPAVSGTAAVESIETKIESAAIAKTNVKAACEFVVETPTHFYLVGWIADNQKAKDFEVVDKKGNVIANYTDSLRINRQDVIDAYGNVPAMKNAGVSMLLKKELNNAGSPAKLIFTVEGDEITLPIDTVYKANEEPATNAMRLLNNWHPNSPSHLKKAQMFSEVLAAIFPASDKATVTRYDFNEKIESPTASLIIPLYGRYDFMRYQLSNFNAGGQTKDCEIIYVIDDPKISADTLKLAKEMAIITTQSFSVLQLSKNLGFGKANNVGVEHASSDIIALINSDILPKSDDWLEKLVETAREPNAGIVGARLLFEDESIQHDGMAPMHVAEYPGLLFNDHPRKGWPVTLSPFSDTVDACPLITAACWVMKKADYDTLNGFAPEYVLGDFEDSDLCLQMLELGRTNYIRRDVELYHLERQSQNLVQPGRWKHNITILNAIYFNNKWKATLEAMEEASV